MELRQLAYFAAVARTGTYAGAAERLQVAQPAVWRQVRQLEDELGVPLFEREGRRVRITSVGTQLLERGEQLLWAADRMQEVAANMRRGQVGVVTVGCTSSHIAGILARVTNEMRRRHPHLYVDLREFDDSIGRLQEQLVDALLIGAVDVITSAPLDDDLGLESFPLYDARITAVLPPRHPQGKQSTLPVQRLREESLLVTPLSDRSRNQVDRACRAAGFEPRIEFESSNPAALLALREQGIGTAVLADDAVPRRATPPSPVLTDDNGPLGVPVWLYLRPGVAELPVVQAFLDVARELASVTAAVSTRSRRRR